MSKHFTNILFNKLTAKKNKEFYLTPLLEQYKLYVEMADRISSRRQISNSFFLSINTAIVALMGYVKSTNPVNNFSHFYWLIAIKVMWKMAQ